MSRSSSSLMIAALLITVLLIASCGGAPPTTTTPATTTTPETLEEILAQAADVKLVKYDCVYMYPEREQTSKVWFKENKMKVEQSYEGQVQTYLLDMDEGTVYTWDPPENEPREMGISTGEVSDFFSAMSMAEDVSLHNPKTIGSESVDGKDCLVVEFVDGEITLKAWLWKEKRFLVRLDIISPEQTTTIAFKNIDFGDIPDSVFELP